MALPRARPCRGYQIHVDYQVSGQMVSGQQLDCHEKKKLAKHLVEDGEDYNGEERRHLYIDCHHLLHHLSLSLSESLCPTTRSKKKYKYKIKEEEHLHYPILKDRKPSLNLKTACVSGLCRALYRQKDVLEYETRPRVKDRHVAPPYCRENAAFAAFLWQNQGLRSLILVSDSRRFQDLLDILGFGYIRPDLRLMCAKVQVQCIFQKFPYLVSKKCGFNYPKMGLIKLLLPFCPPCLICKRDQNTVQTDILFINQQKNVI